MISNKKLAIIGAGRMACIYAERARKMGVESHVFAWRKGAMAADVCDVFHDVSVVDIDEIACICREIGVGGVVATSEFTIAPCAQVAQALGLPGNPVEVANGITDKSRNRRLVEGVEGLSQPRWWRIANLADIDQLDFTYPVVVKPTSEGGKRGVSVARNEDELRRAVSYAEGEPSRSHAYLVEEFVGGSEYSVETLSWHGESRVVQVTEKISSGAPHCVELGHDQPARIPDAMRSRIEDVVPRALRAIGLQSGPCHTEVKIWNDGIYLIEFNARPGGDHIAADLTRLSTGRSYIGSAIEIALDEFDPTVLDELQHWYSGIRFVTQLSPELAPVFDTCQEYAWCHEKHQATSGLVPYEHNDGYNVNYFIYASKTSRPVF